MVPEMSDNSGNPSFQFMNLSPEITLQPPLSCGGFGPGLILVRPSHYSQWEHHNTTLDREPIQKRAEEGYVVVQNYIQGYPKCGQPGGSDQNREERDYTTSNARVTHLD